MTPRLALEYLDSALWRLLPTDPAATKLVRDMRAMINNNNLRQISPAGEVSANEAVEIGNRFADFAKIGRLSANARVLHRVLGFTPATATVSNVAPRPRTLTW